MVGKYSTVTDDIRSTFWGYAYTSYTLSAATPESRTLLADWKQVYEQRSIGRQSLQTGVGRHASGRNTDQANFELKSK